MLIYRKTQSVLIGCLTALLLLSCSGTGGAADSVATTYGAGGGTTSANTGSGGISAIDILNRSNADDMETVVAILSQTGGGSRVNYELSRIVTLNADDIGLPAGGKVILTISGEGMDDIELTAERDADGTVSFEIPAIETGTTVTVSMDVKNATNETVRIGSETQSLLGEESRFDIKLTRCLPLSELESYLASLTENTAGTAYKLPPITGITQDNLSTLKSILQGLKSGSSTYDAPAGKFVDLSATTLPEGITSLRNAFFDCQTLVKAPVLPASVTDLYRCFGDCYSLIEAQEIPDGVTDMQSCFNSTRITSAPVIPSSVTNLRACFQGCLNMSGDIVIKASITESANIQYFCDSAELVSAIYVPDAATKNALVSVSPSLEPIIHTP